MLKMLLILFIALSAASADSVLSAIEAKLKVGDYPTGATSPEYKADKKPHLLDLMEQASENKDKSYIPVMKQIAANKKMFWEIRQEAIRYLSSFSSQKEVKLLLKKYASDKSEPLEIREAAKSGI